MSIVTNVILHIGIIEEEDERLNDVNKFFSEDCEKMYFTTDHGSGSKNLECFLCLGAYNFFDLNGFVKHLESINWESPETLQLFVKEQEDEVFSIKNLKFNK